MNIILMHALDTLDTSWPLQEHGVFLQKVAGTGYIGYKEAERATEGCHITIVMEH